MYGRTRSLNSNSPASPPAQAHMPQTPHVAYFCMEFGLHESFPIYAGGLGVLAGDFIKSAHDLKLPVVAVTLRWERGYGVQRIGPDGMPHEEFPGYDSSF